VVIYNPRFTRPDDRMIAPAVTQKRPTINPRLAAMAMAQGFAQGQQMAQSAPPPIPAAPPVYAVRGDASGRPLIQSRPVVGATPVAAAPVRDPLAPPIGTVPDTLGASATPYVVPPPGPLNAPGLNTSGQPAPGLLAYQDAVQRQQPRPAAAPPPTASTGDLNASGALSGNYGYPVRIDADGSAWITIPGSGEIQIPADAVPDGARTVDVSPQEMVSLIQAETQRQEQVGRTALGSGDAATAEASVARIEQLRATEAAYVGATDESVSLNLPIPTPGALARRIGDYFTGSPSDVGTRIGETTTGGGSCRRGPCR
jgi:hypothetical protein